jgi:dTDP-4-amino-4,6-dideoxygalactose transaminase
MIKFFDLYKQDKDLHKSMLKKIESLFIKGDFILGKEVEIFEKNFSKFCGAKYSVSCANGTDALTLALKSLNLPYNSEVIMPAMTYCSTAFSIIAANLKPILVDTEKLSSTISIHDLKKKITKRTKVILPVHLYGSTANLKAIKKIIKNKKIYLIDDCAQAHGAYDDSDNKKKKIGSASDISCFSLYPGKNLGAYGDAGIITTNNLNFYNKLRKLRNLGSEKKFIHDVVGFNSRLDTIQAIILNEKLKNITLYNKKRQKIAKFYNQTINNKRISKLNYSKSSVYHQYVILVDNRNSLIKLLKKNKIQYGFHYPYAIHQLNVFKKRFKNKRYKNAEILAQNSISLPIDPNLSKKELNYIVKTLNEF